MTLLPFWALRPLRALMHLSDWIDDKFFPLPATPADQKQRHVQDIEDCALMIKKQIEKCTSLKEAYDIWDALRDFKAIWGDTVQVNAWVESLIVDLRNKETAIINNL